MKASGLRIRSKRGVRWLSCAVLAIVAMLPATAPASPVQSDMHSYHNHAGHMALAAATTGSSLRFNGSSNYVRVADNASLRIPVNITVEAWIKPTGVSGHRHVVGKNNYELSIEPSGSGFKALWEFSSGGSWRSVASGSYPLNQWYHVAGIYDGSNVRLFVNGSRVASIQTSGNIDQTSNPLRIGSADASGDFFPGYIDEVRVSNVVRYTGNFVQPQAPFTADSTTKGLWHLDEGSGTTTADASGNNNNGTLLNSPAWSTDVPFSGPDTTPPVISAVAASNITSTGATISWTTDESSTSQIEYGQTTAYGALTTLDAALVTSHRQTLSGLSPNTTYNYRVISKDAAGNSAVSANFQFATSASDPPAAPTISGVAAGNLTTSSATISWSTDVPADSQVEYGTTTSYGSITSLDPALVTAHSVTITGLAANTTYHYRVKSRGENGVLATSGDGVFTTGTDTAASIGQWSSAQSWPLVAVHTALLPDGNVLTWDAWELKPNVAARIWNPTSQSFTAVTNQFSSIFCAGHSALADGRLLVAGGFTQQEYGIKDTNIFNPATNSWTRVGDMNYARWYPSTTTLPDGRVLALGGQISPGLFADIPEVFDPATNSWSQLPNARRNVGEYPLTYLAPDGKVFIVAGPDYKSHLLDVGAQQWTTLGDAPVPSGTSVMYRPGKVLATGGGSPNVDPVNRNAAVIDLNQSNPGWRTIGQMAQPRFQHNLVVLPDGNVLAVGGSTQYSLVSTQGVRAAEMWNAGTESWSTMASMRDLRLYHSTALLLPDGRVLVAGGGRAAPAVDYLTAEIYSPPYLFKGARPAITGAPGAVNYGDAIAIQTPNAADIASVAFVRLGSNTHAFDMDQRYVPLSFTKNAGSLSVQSPIDARTTPPGNYMLFIVNSAGVPSVASTIRIGGPTQVDTQAPTVSLTSPANGATVTGSTTIAANASDNVGVSSVQFLLNGAPLGAADVSAPYSIAWDTTTAPDGSHTLSAQARDAAGNIGTASSISVTVANTANDQTPPTLSAIGASAVGSTSATIGWTTNEPATSQVEYGTTTAYGTTSALSSSLVTNHSVALTGLTASTTYHYRVLSRDAAGNLATSPDQTFATTAPAPLTLLGETTVRSNQDNNAAGMAEAFQYTASTSGTANKLFIYLDGNNTATQVVVGIYANTRDDNPGTLLAQATISNPVKGAWNSVSIAPTAITGGAKYWLAVLGPVNGGLVQFRDVASGGKAQTSAQSNLSILPASWTPGANYFNSPMSAYLQQAP